MLTPSKLTLYALGSLTLLGCETAHTPSGSPDAGPADVVADTPQDGDEGPAETAGGDALGTPPTYHDHLQPLLAQYCVACHASGGIGPFPLDSFEAAQQWATPMADAVADRRMPPYLADASGHCGEFQDSRWLSQQDIAVFEQWASTGTLEGTAPAEPVEPAPLPKLEGPTLPVDMGFDYLPDQALTDDYRCFVLPGPAEAVAVTGFDVLPGNPRIAHHLIAYQAWDEAAATQLATIDEQDEGPGFACLGTGPPVDVITVAGWAPGTGATLFPAGSGIELKPDLPIIIEMHYNIAGGPGETDRTVLELQVADSGTVEPIIEIGGIDYDFSAPPEQASWSTTEDTPVYWSLWDVGMADYTGKLLLHGVNGHMHQRGLSMKMWAVSGGDDVCVMDIPRWDFNWQLTYWFETPIEIDAADAIRITCEFQTLGLTEPLTWGDGTNDEMCLGGIYATLVD